MGAQLLRPCVGLFTAAESKRVRAFIASVGSIEGARMRLGVAACTMDAARDQGRVLLTTRDKVMAAIDREEGRS